MDGSNCRAKPLGGVDSLGSEERSGGEVRLMEQVPQVHEPSPRCRDRR